jgi:hypothetical protein
VVCGHIHKADARRLAEDAGGESDPGNEDRSPSQGVEYFNCGDWVESCTALVEHDCGRLEVIEAIEWLDGRESDDLASELDELEAWPEIPMPLPLPVPRSFREIRLG